MAKSLEELMNQIKRDCVQVLDKETSEEIKEIESEDIKEKVLNTYIPASNKRRPTGGIDDIDNMKHSITESNNTITLTVTNETPTVYDRDYRLDEAIENGGDLYEYPYKNRDREKYPYLKGRPFTESTQEKVNIKVDEIFIKKLKENGVKIK